MNEAIRISPQKKALLFTEHWSPKIVGTLNDCQIQLVKIQGEFVWHHHESDELFIVVRGRVTMQLKDKNLEAGPGEMILIPSMIEHCPKTEAETLIILIDKIGTINTGNVQSDKTVTDYLHI